MRLERCQAKEKDVGVKVNLVKTGVGVARERCRGGLSDVGVGIARVTVWVQPFRVLCAVLLSAVLAVGVS